MIDYINVENLIKVMNYYKFKVFDGNSSKGSKSHDLNIVNIRNDNPNAGKFDDTQVVFYRYKKEWHLWTFSVTTDPGVPYLLNPMNKKGTAIVAPGQYRGVWKIGLHRGKYEALVQAKPIVVIRDNNKDVILNSVTYEYMKHSSIYAYFKNTEHSDIISYDGKYYFEEGYFGINCHRASAYGIREKVGLYSAGCCVHDNPKYYAEFIRLLREAAINWENSFTATWITETDYFNALHAIENN